MTSTLRQAKLTAVNPTGLESRNATCLPEMRYGYQPAIEEPYPTPTWLSNGRIPALDGLRALAVLLVICAHAHQTSQFPDFTALHLIGRVGPIGVDVFFVLSGFLITTLVLRESERNGCIDLVAFYRRRLLRIVPPFAVLMVTVAILQILGHAELGPRDWIAALTFTTNFQHHPAWELGHAWSLSIEEHFYLIWPFIVMMFPPAWLSSVLLFSMATCFCLRWVILLGFPALTPMAELWTFTRLDTIAIGCLLAVLARQPHWRRRFDRSTRWWPIWACVLVASLYLGSLSAKWSVGCGFTINSFCIAILIWAATRLDPRWLSWRPIAIIGICSYSLYLWQQIFLNSHRDSWFTTFPQNLIFAAIAAGVSYRLVESPCTRLKDRNARAEPQRRAVDGAA